MEITSSDARTEAEAAMVQHIVITPETCGGRPRIAGRRITVQQIVLMHERGGLSPDEIVSKYAGLTLGDVYAALSYYHDHREQIREQIRADEEFADQLRAQSTSCLREKQVTQHAADNPLPS